MPNRVFSVQRYTVHGARILVTVCLIVTQHREPPGCENTAGGSAQGGWVCLRRCHLDLLSCVHPSLRTIYGQRYRGQTSNPRPRPLGSCQKPHELGLRPPWIWHERFPSGHSPPKYARIAITRDIVRPAHGAAIVSAQKHEVPHAVGIRAGRAASTELAGTRAAGRHVARCVEQRIRKPLLSSRPR